MLCVFGVCLCMFRYLMGEFFKDPVSCLTLASYLITNTGEGGPVMGQKSRRGLSVLA